VQDQRTFSAHHAAGPQLPACRWAVDTGTIRGHPRAGDWAEACWWVVSHTVAHLWLTVTGPDWVRGVLRRFPPDRLAVWSNVPLGLACQAASTADLARWSCRYGRSGSDHD
jgi:hypothetical protein